MTDFAYYGFALVSYGKIRVLVSSALEVITVQN